jgi:hypothetical protein
VAKVLCLKPKWYDRIIDMIGTNVRHGSLTPHHIERFGLAQAQPNRYFLEPLIPSSALILAHDQERLDLR